MYGYWGAPAKCQRVQYSYVNICIVDYLDLSWASIAVAIILVYNLRLRIGMNEEHDEQIINKYIKIIQIIYVHVNFQQYVMVGKIKKRSCVVSY